MTGTVDNCRGGEPTYKIERGDGEARLRELILYIADKSAGDVHFGAVKLNKALWLSDFLSFRRYGEPITGVEYIRKPRGPVARRLLPIREDMRRNGEIVLREPRLGNHTQVRVIPTREANLEGFSGRDIALVDEVIGLLRKRTARQASDDSHGIAWRLAGEDQPIPYEAIFLSDEGITPYDVTRTRELSRVHGWADR